MTKAVIFDLFETLITEYSNGSRTSKRNYDYMKLLACPTKILSRSGEVDKVEG